jgi:hypothetical protein
MLLSVGSPAKDEDPCVLLARDGSIYIVWFSDRGGNSDIYLTRTSDGVEWMPPVRITTSIHGDFYPQLIQDDAGVFHLTWFRWEAYFRGHIWYSRSENGITWDSTAEVQVTTTDNVDDWVPVITQAGNGTLVIYFVSAVRSSVTNEIYVTSRSPSDSQWSCCNALAGDQQPDGTRSSSSSRTDRRYDQPCLGTSRYVAIHPLAASEVGSVLCHVGQWIRLVFAAQNNHGFQ